MEIGTVLQETKRYVFMETEKDMKWNELSDLAGTKEG